MNENKLVQPIEYTGKFKAGDRVKVIAATKELGLDNVGKTGTLSATFYRSWEGAEYLIEYDEGGGGHLNEVCLELVSRVTHEDFSKEYAAVAYLLRHRGSELRQHLLEKLNTFARIYLENQDYNNAREVMDIAEELKESQK